MLVMYIHTVRHTLLGEFLTIKTDSIIYFFCIFPFCDDYQTKNTSSIARPTMQCAKHVLPPIAGKKIILEEPISIYYYSLCPHRQKPLASRAPVGSFRKRENPRNISFQPMTACRIRIYILYCNIVCNSYYIFRILVIHISSIFPRSVTPYAIHNIFYVMGNYIIFYNAVFSGYSTPTKT